MKTKTANRRPHRTNLRTVVNHFVANRSGSHRWTHKCQTVVSAVAVAGGGDGGATAAGDDCYRRMAIWIPVPDWATG